MQVFRSAAAVKAAFKSTGSHWFDADAMRFFNSRVQDRVYGGRVFVSSEKRNEETVRSYHVRLIEWSPENGYSIASVGDFMGGMSAAEAKAKAQLLADIIGACEKRYGYFPDRLEYGQDVALAKALDISASGSDDGWVFNIERWAFER